MSAHAVNEPLFTRARRGYDPGEVDDYLERFADYAAKLEDRAVAAESALEDCGSTLGELRQRLVAATGVELSGRLAEILTLAEQEAHDVRDRARLEAQSIIEHATRTAEEVRRTCAEQRLEVEHAIRELFVVRDGYLSDLRALGTEIGGAADRYDPGTSRPDASQEPLPVFAAADGLAPVSDPSEPTTPTDDVSTVART